MIPDRAGNVEHWEIDKMTVILLRQFKRLLAQRGVELSDSEMQLLGMQVAERQPLDAPVGAITDAMQTIIGESVAVLDGWNLTFADALATDMTDLAHLWETTAEFLDLANEKVNAEVRISAGASLLCLLGDPSFAPFLLAAIDHDLRENQTLDVDAAIGRRALLHAAKIDREVDDWLEQVRAFVAASAQQSDDV